jgi:hypothetical protein
MGKKSRLKHNRPMQEFTETGNFNSWFDWIDRYTILFVLGVYATCYGLSACQYSRWDHEFNKHVTPVFHPWATILGIVMIVISIRFRPKSQ